MILRRVNAFNAFSGDSILNSRPFPVPEKLRVKYTVPGKSKHTVPKKTITDKVAR